MLVIGVSVSLRLALDGYFFVSSTSPTPSYLSHVIYTICFQSVLRMRVAKFHILVSIVLHFSYYSLEVALVTNVVMEQGRNDKKFHYILLVHRRVLI